MVSYKIIWKKSAYKELRNIHKEYILKIINAVEKHAKNPFPPRVKNYPVLKRHIVLKLQIIELFMNWNKKDKSFK